MDDTISGCSKEELTKTLQTVLALALYGIDIEKTDEMTENGFPKIVYFFSVPESSTIELDDLDKYKDLVKSSEGLITVAKDTLTDLLFESFKMSYGEDIDRKEVADSMKFYAKVRKGEIWSLQKGKEKIDSIMNSIQNPDYKCV